MKRDLYLHIEAAIETGRDLEKHKDNTCNGDALTSVFERRCFLRSPSPINNSNLIA